MSNYNFSYFDNNNNNEMEELDRMAREINDKKKKFNLIKELSKMKNSDVFRQMEIILITHL